MKLTRKILEDCFIDENMIKGKGWFVKTHEHKIGKGYLKSEGWVRPKNLKKILNSFFEEGRTLIHFEIYKPVVNLRFISDGGEDQRDV